MKLCMITGANSGIGKRAAAQIAQKGVGVVMVCRSLARGEAAREDIMRQTGAKDVWVMQADLSLLADARRVVADFAARFDHLDVLINNAADFDLTRKTPKRTDEGFESQFATNVLAPHLLSAELLPLLQKSGDGRILNISSQGLMVYPNLRFDFDHVDGSGKYSPANTYYQNKLGLLMNSLTLREKLSGANVSVQAIRVTNVKIDEDRYPDLSPVLKTMYSLKRRFSMSPEKMAEVYTALATAPRREGFLYDEKTKEVQANRNAYEPEARARLWQLCCQMTGSGSEL